MNAQERLDYLLQNVTAANPDSWATGARGLRDFDPGPDGWDGMLNRLNELGYGSVARQTEIGMDYASPKVQLMLDQLGLVAPDIFTPDRVTTLKAWGVSTRKRWQIDGYASEPTLKSITAELEFQAAGIALQKSKDKAARNKAAIALTYQVVQNQIESLDVVTLEVAQATFNAELASRWEE